MRKNFPLKLLIKFSAISDRHLEKRGRTTIISALYKLSTPPAVGLLNLLTLIGVFIAILAFFGDLQRQNIDRIFNAWQTLSMGVNGDYGKKAALEYLNTQDCPILLGSAGAISDWLHATGVLDNPPRCAFGLHPRKNGFYQSDQIKLSGIVISHGDYSKDNILDDIRLVDAEVSESDMSFSRLNRADLRSSIFRLSDLNYSRILNGNLSHVSFSYSKLNCLTSSSTKYIGSSFFHTELSGAWFLADDFGRSYIADNSSENSVFIRANFSGATILDTVFFGSMFQNSVFSNVFISDVKFIDSDLSLSRFQNLRTAGTTEVDISGSQVTSVKFDNIDQNIKFVGKGAWYCKGSPPNINSTNFKADLKSIDCLTNKTLSNYKVAQSMELLDNSPMRICPYRKSQW